MGILDDAIKEHLELKRQHGAGESELKQLEDEAFGAAERPGDEQPPADALSEAPTAFMAQPELPEDEAAGAEAAESSGKRRLSPQLADLQEPPEAEAPAEEEAPAMEHEAVAEPEPEPVAEAEEEADEQAEDAGTGHSTEERHAIAEQPTEMYDVEEALAGQEPQAPAEVEVTDTREESDEDFEDDFWDEKRLSDELDQALEAPLEHSAPLEEAEPEVAAEPESEPESEADAEAPASTPEASETPEHEDVLEDTPDFLEQAPEDDQLWFEQKPPKDFDFDD